MAYMKVEHRKFENAAVATERYVTLMKNMMRSAQSEVTTLSTTWQGTDSVQFKAEFDKVDNEGSTHAQMLKALESYAQYLRFATSKYKGAQTSAINRANGLPRY